MKKRFRVKTGTRLFEIPNHPDIRLFEPRMSYFREMSMAVTEILHKYVPPEAIHVYSVDESFIDLTGTEKLWGDPSNTIQRIQKEILNSLQLHSSAGVGPTLGLGYSKNAFGGGFQRARTIYEATNDTMKIYKVCLDLLKENYDNKPVRQLSVSITKLEDEHSMQLSLFEKDNWKNRKLASAMDSIRNRFGTAALLRAVSYTPAETAVKRSKMVGGHKG